MKKSVLLQSIAVSLLAGKALAAPASLTVNVKGIEEGKPIPAQFAYCVPDGRGKSKGGSNINPEISWSGAPEGVKSYALIMVDTEVPAKFDDANQEGKTIAADFPRQDFYHWVLVNVPSSVTKIAEGQDSKGTPEGGKPVGKTAYGMNVKNDYAKVYPGSFGGYDGPCPPWNDLRMHQYHFNVYALNVESVSIADTAGGADVMKAITPHIIAQGKITGTYTQNVSLLK